MDEERQKELFFKFQLFEQQIQNLQQQLESVEKAILDMNKLSYELPEIKEGKEILALIGKGIFAKAKIISEELNVDIGGGKFVKKTIPETKEIIGKQIKNLEDIKKQIEESLEEINSELTKNFMESQKIEKS
jgi:prefoldin alpha subunit